VNIHDLEIAHSSEGAAGIVLLIVDGALVGRFLEGLAGRDYRATSRSLE
jgi:hypothetical protein